MVDELSGNILAGGGSFWPLKVCLIVYFVVLDELKYFMLDASDNFLLLQIFWLI